MGKVHRISNKTKHTYILQGTDMTPKNALYKPRFLFAILFMLTFSMLSFRAFSQTDEKEWVGKLFNYTNIGLAKKYALENNRPLLAIYIFWIYYLAKNVHHIGEQKCSHRKNAIK